LELNRCSGAQKAEFHKLLNTYFRFIDWQAELVNHSTEEGRTVYGEELAAWRVRVRQFRQGLA
jgi:hypothetical protein